jgi:ABC-2 type transport system permease protein
MTLVKREYFTRVKTKGFIIGTILLPVFIVFLMFLNPLIARINAKAQGTTSIAVIDFSGQVYEPLDASLSASKRSDQDQALYKLQRIDASREALEGVKQKLNQEVIDGKLNAFLIIPTDVLESNQFEMYSKNVSNFAFNQNMGDAISNSVISRRMQQSGLDGEMVKKLSHHVEAKTFKVGQEGSKEESGAFAFILSYGMIFIMYMALIFYGTFVMRGVTEDKSSRVIEVLVSSASPHQLMAGKIIGIGAAGLTQFIIWAITAALVSAYGLFIVRQFAPAADKIPIPSISIWIYVSFVVFFVLGYFLYATLYAAIGSMVSAESEAQSIQWPVLIFLVIAFMLMFAIMNSPDSSLAVVLSLIPFFAPILMFFRISVNAVPLMQVIASILIMVATFWGLIWVTGRIFRVGILMYGKRPTLPELMKWIRYS